MQQDDTQDEAQQDQIKDNTKLLNLLNQIEKDTDVIGGYLGKLYLL